jgi:hypothetical protein
VLFHASTNAFVVSPAAPDSGDLTLPLLAAGAKWLIVLVIVAVSGPRLVNGPQPEVLART